MSAMSLAPSMALISSTLKTTTHIRLEFSSPFARGGLERGNPKSGGDFCRRGEMGSGFANGRHLFDFVFLDMHDEMQQ